MYSDYSHSIIASWPNQSAQIYTKPKIGELTQFSFMLVMNVAYLWVWVV